jgi:hypothetical protein
MLRNNYFSIISSVAAETAVSSPAQIKANALPLLSVWHLNFAQRRNQLFYLPPNPSGRLNYDVHFKLDKTNQTSCKILTKGHQSENSN